MTELPTPAKESYGAGPKPTAYYTVDQMRDYGRAEYLRAIQDAAKLCESTYWSCDIEAWRDMTKKEVSAKSMHECAAAIRALAGEKTCTSDEWLANCPQSVRDLANKIKQEMK